MLYIHIGFHKTGTTTIQNFMKLNREILEHHGIVYPTLGLKGAHFELAKEFRNRRGKPARNGWVQLKALIDASPDKDYALSAETFHILPPSQVQNIGQAVHGVPITVIAYIRELNQIIPSRYAQRVKTGGKLATFDEFFESQMSSGGEDGLKYFKQIKRWADVFGWESIRVRTLDKQALVAGDLLADYISAIGLDWAEIAPNLAPDSLSARNIAPGWKALELLRELHEASGAMTANREEKQKEDGVKLRNIASSIRRTGQEIAERQGLNVERGLYLTEEQWNRSNAKFDADLRRLNEHLIGYQLPLPRRQKFAERAFLPTAASVPAEERAAFYEELLFKFAAEVVPLVRRSVQKGRREGKQAEQITEKLEPLERTSEIPKRPPMKRAERRALREAKRATTARAEAEASKS